MNTKGLEEHAKNMHKQAGELLQSNNLLHILEKYGDVYLIGSYPLDIMYGPDIDIVVKTREIRKNSMDALHEIVDKELFRKIEHGNFVKFPMDNRPKGYILVLKAEVENIKWEIEIWFLNDISKQLSEYEILKSKISKIALRSWKQNT